MRCCLANMAANRTVGELPGGAARGERGRDGDQRDCCPMGESSGWAGAAFAPGARHDVRGAVCGSRVCGGRGQARTSRWVGEGRGCVGGGGEEGREKRDQGTVAKRVLISFTTRFAGRARLLVLSQTPPPLLLPLPLSLPRWFPLPACAAITALHPSLVTSHLSFPSTDKNAGRPSTERGRCCRCEDRV